MNSYSYFVSYFYSRKDGSGMTGFGNLQTLRDKPITQIKDTSLIAREVEEELCYEKGSVVVVSFQIFDSE